MTLGAGEQFAGYTIVRQVGSGGMGEVYLAKHPRLPRQEALKILHPQISDDDIFRQRFIREADSVAALQHPNIVTVHDRGEDQGQLWIATQFVDGTDAAKLLSRYPAGLPADEVSQITAAIAQALDHAHERGVLHRDVKPANILLTQPDRDGVRRIYLADFGIARPLDDPAGLTATNFTLGTVAYAAPEQLMGKPTDGRADQYALAATAYNMLTGTTLFNESNPVAVISHHLSEPPPAPSKQDPALAPFDGVFARALAKNPGDRYPRCQDFARALAAAAAASGVTSPTALTQQAPIPASPSTPNSPAPASRRPHDDESKRRFNMLVATVAIVAAALLGVAVAAILPSQIGRKSTPTPQPTSAAPSSAASQTTTSPRSTAESTPATPTPIAQYLAGVGVTGQQLSLKELTDLAVKLPRPPGWTTYDNPNLSPGTEAIAKDNNFPTAMVMVFKLDGNFDVQAALEHADDDAELTKNFKRLNYSDADFDGFPSAMVEGSYDSGSTRLHTYNRIVIPVTPFDRYLVQFTVTTLAEQAAADAPDVLQVIEGFSVAVK